MCCLSKHLKHLDCLTHCEANVKVCLGGWMWNCFKTKPFSSANRSGDPCSSSTSCLQISKSKCWKHLEERLVDFQRYCCKLSSFFPQVYDIGNLKGTGRCCLSEKQAHQLLRSILTVYMQECLPEFRRGKDRSWSMFCLQVFLKFVVCTSSQPYTLLAVIMLKIAEPCFVGFL